MIEPVHFGYNAEAAATNSFMQTDGGASQEQKQRIHERARQEFHACVEMLKGAGVHVLVYRDTHEPHTPDSIFPNNWFSTHSEGTLVLYPMETANRRLERRLDIVHDLLERYRYCAVVDCSPFEHLHCYLEGTGSLVLDRINRIVYANVSSRMHTRALHYWAAIMNFTPITFTASRYRRADSTSGISDASIYHTNVMMSIGDDTAVICSESIIDKEERERVLASLRRHQSHIVELSLEQLEAFAGNMLQVHGADNQKFWVMSSQAYKALTDEQRDVLSRNSLLLHTPIETIERYGGGSVRCMLAEIFSPQDVEVKS